MVHHHSADGAERSALSLRAVVGAWYDQERNGRAIWILLALFVAFWVCFHLIVFSAIGLSDDLIEVFNWSRHLSAGYSKHPPLAGLMAAAWFSVFPIAEWSFHLLAMVNCAIALFAIYMIAGRYVAGDKRLVVLLLLLLTPFYQFHGQRFSTNQTLLSIWPIATYCFLRAFQSRGVAWSAAAGITAALAILGKYYSVYLVGGFIIAALADPRRLQYLRSPAPWVSVLCGAAVLAPHLIWLVQMGPEPFRYAMVVHGSDSHAQEWRSILVYAVGAIGYVALPVATYLVAVRPDRQVLKTALWPGDSNRRLLVLLAAAWLVLPILTAPILGIKLTPLWTMQAWFLLPIILLAPPQVELSRAAAVAIAAVVGIIMVIVLAASPVVAWRNYLRESTNGRAYYRVLGPAVTQAWRTAIGRPLTIVTGDYPLAQSVGFYSPDHPDYTPDFGSSSAPWVTEQHLADEGWTSVCFADHQQCLATAERTAAGHAGVVRVNKELVVSFFGLSPASAQVVFIMVPPQR